ncbi:metallo-beta-lactamase domain protein [Stylonychia lemnae]|uniref:Metallo-beta-lactamase domain protein n=1 Tax=Stylonychia lemnae TaxID=5949 RepID=A0A077ZXJ8_STYLE|nr:metallo-beta-lactamase domain protein [Stylonychia lemnae]|eukprot:CDW74286.1 metallo-beta-lactamase domain protein [Stylonychia lemnae]
MTQNVWLIPGENPGDGFLCGTNVYIVGQGQKRFLIDACHRNNLKFLDNIRVFLRDQNCQIELGHASPIVLKYVCDNLETDQLRLFEHPDLAQYLFNIREGDVFLMDDWILKPIETPGHIKDHLCFLLEQKEQETILFTGDHIIGSDSTFFMDYPEYLRSLEKIKRMTNVKKFLMAHSMSFEMKDLLVDAQQKVQQYLDIRKRKDDKLESYINVFIYQSLQNTLVTGKLHTRITERRLKKFVEEYKIRLEGDRYFVVKL